jgi:hypothetical protein
MAEAPIGTEQPKNRIEINNTIYKVDVVIHSKQGTAILPMSIVEQLIVRDSLYSIFSSAELVIDDSNDQFENLVFTTNNELKEEESIPLFIPNETGFDLLSIELVPESFLDENEDTVEIHRRNFFYIIYDEQAQEQHGQNKKRKKLILKDVRQHLLETNSIPWSTAQALKRIYKDNINLNHVGNSLREINTGDAIKDLLKEGLSELEVDENIFDVWDSGASKTFMSSCAGVHLMDILEELLDNHISTTVQDNCILKFDDRTNTFSLTPLTQLFQNIKGRSDNTKYGQGLQDIFHVNGDTLRREDNNQTSAETSAECVSTILEGIANYIFLNFASKDAEEQIQTVHVHSRDYYNKQFNVDSEDTQIDEIKKKYQELYAAYNHGKNPTAIFPINERNKENKLVLNETATGSEIIQRRKSGLNKILSKAINFAPSIQFSAEGSTYRVPGKAMLIVNKNPEPNSAASIILPGDWLVTNINHVFLFSQNAYINDITAVKSYSNKSFEEIKGKQPVEGQS